MKNQRDSKIKSLTEDELEVIKLIGKGLKNKAIAERLLISEAIIGHQISSIFAKLDLEDRLNLVIFAYQNNLIERKNH